MAYRSETGYTPTTLDPSNYGITYDKDAIKSVFDNATAAQYKALRNEAKVNENQFYQNQYNNQAAALDTIRKANAQAIATGASKGLQAANELSAILNLQQQSTEEATQLAANRANLAAEEQAAYAQNAASALSMANAAGEALYNADTQTNIGQMQYYAAIEEALKNLEGVKYNADRNYDASVYTADKNYEAAKYTADKNYSASRYTADKNYSASKYTADSNLAGNKYTADKNYASNVYVADRNLEGNKYTADQNLAGTKYNADQNLAGTIYNANKYAEGQIAYANAYRDAAAISAEATKYAAEQSAAATKYAAAANGSSTTGNMYLDDVLQKAVKTGGAAGKAAYVATLISQGMSEDAANASWDAAVNKKYDAITGADKPVKKSSNKTSSKSWRNTSDQWWMHINDEYNAH